MPGGGAVPVPAALAAPAPDWVREVDVVVLGSGAGGLAAALAARPARSVLLVTKDTLDAGSTAWAQGGLAAVLDPADSLEDHVRDTIAAGAGLCDEAVVRELVAAAPVAIRGLMTLGAMFDPAAEGDGPALGREGGHSHNRIVHARGDQSGAEVQRTLDQAAVAAGVDVLERAFALDLLTGIGTDGRRRVAGVRIGLVGAAGEVLSVGEVRARAVVLATGGYGQVFASTSNPAALTGDGVALALRAGLPARDLEFVQFHPTVFWRGPDARGQQPLISEAVRGEGAVLRDTTGRRIMAGVHPLEDMAPRDVVAAAIAARMAEAPGGVDDHVVLDATHLGERFAIRFPSITAACRANGVDPATQWIPVAPAAHYACGGVVATLSGETELPGLYAVGEVACTGLHGANRLASNSLTESVVAGTRVGAALAEALPPAVAGPADAPEPDGPLMDPGHRAALRTAMSRWVGVMRGAEGLAAAAEVLAGLAGDRREIAPSRSAWEATNLLTVASAVVVAASVRPESRGCHRRSDHPSPREEWRRHVEMRLRDGAVTPAPSGAALATA
jgi:L-aspartate oxidase